MVSNYAAYLLFGSLESLLVNDGLVAHAAFASASNAVIIENKLVIGGHESKFRVTRRWVGLYGVLSKPFKGVVACRMAWVPLESGILLPSLTMSHVLLHLIQIGVLIYLVCGFTLWRLLMSTIFLLTSGVELFKIARWRRRLFYHTVARRVLPI
jgi:hypothetical protein